MSEKFSYRKLIVNQCYERSIFIGKIKSNQSVIPKLSFVFEFSIIHIPKIPDKIFLKNDYQSQVVT